MPDNHILLSSPIPHILRCHLKPPCCETPNPLTPEKHSPRPTRYPIPHQRPAPERITRVDVAALLCDFIIRCELADISLVGASYLLAPVSGGRKMHVRLHSPCALNGAGKSTKTKDAVPRRCASRQPSHDVEMVFCLSGRYVTSSRQQCVLFREST